MTKRSVRLATAAAMIAVVCASPGCKHHRSALRPVFVDPEPVLIEPAPTNSMIVPAEPAPYAAPNLEPGYQGSTGPSYVPPPAGEPALELDPLNEQPAPPPRDEQTVPSDVQEPPAVEPPVSMRGAPSTSSPTTRRAALRAQVQAMADDPIDLVQPPKADRPWQYIVLHHSASTSGGYAQLDRAHRERGGLDGCGYHFVIGNGTGSPDGTIEVTRRWSEQRPGAHCRDVSHPQVNEYGIGICLVGDFENQPPTPKQIKAARALVAYFQDRYLIPDSRVGTHSALAMRPTACPGQQFPTEAILGQSNSLVSR